jgi:hypothetical protein
MAFSDQDWGRGQVYLGTTRYLAPFGGDPTSFYDPRKPQIPRPGASGFSGGYGSAMQNLPGVAPIGMPKPAVTGPVDSILRPGGQVPELPGGDGIGDKLKGIAGGVGGAIGKGVGWLTDKDQGYLRQLLLSQLIGTAGSIYEANKVGKREDEDRKREQRSRDSVTPMFGKLLAELSQR